jgi:hypothetical protein
MIEALGVQCFDLGAGERSPLPQPLHEVGEHRER